MLNILYNHFQAIIYCERLCNSSFASNIFFLASNLSSSIVKLYNFCANYATFFVFLAILSISCSFLFTFPYSYIASKKYRSKNAWIGYLFYYMDTLGDICDAYVSIVVLVHILYIEIICSEVEHITLVIEFHIFRVIEGSQKWLSFSEHTLKVGWGVFLLGTCSFCRG